MDVYQRGLGDVFIQSENNDATKSPQNNFLISDNVSDNEKTLFYKF